MSYTINLIEELNILALYNLNTSQEGIKVHTTAEQDAIEATRRLFEKGLLSQEDGGYLTGPGRVAAEHAQTLLTILTARAYH